VANGAILTIAHTTIDHNDYGLSNNGTATLTASTVSDNDSTGVGTGFGQTTMKDNTIADNTGIGVAAFTGTTSVTDTTIVGNQFHGVASAPNPYAGAPAIDITDNTIADNAPDGLDGNLQPGASGTSITVAGSIVSNNTTNDCTGIVGDAGYNLASDGSCPFAAAGSVTSTNPDLGPLAANGGRPRPSPRRRPVRPSTPSRPGRAPPKGARACLCVPAPPTSGASPGPSQPPPPPVTGVRLNWPPRPPP
jgi:Right handed beta helix region